MRVLFFVRPHLWRIRGGDTVQVDQTAQALRNLGVAVDVVADRRQAIKLLREGQVHAVHLWNLGRPQDAWALLPWTGDIPVVFSPLWVDYSAFDRQRFLGLPLPWEGIKAVAKALLGKDRWIPWAVVRYGWKGAQQRALDRAQKIIPTTPREARRIEQAFPGTAGKIEPIGPGVWPSLLSPMYQESLHPKKRHGWVCVGRIEGIKNQAALAAAWGLLAKRGLDVGPLTFVGEIAPNHASYGRTFARQIAAARAAGAEIHWHPGGLDAQDLGQRYKQAVGVVVPSLFETYGLTALEGLAAGCRVVLTTQAESSDLLKPYVTWGHPSPDGLAGAVEKALRREESMDGNAYARQQTWEAVAHALLPHYHQLTQPLRIAIQGCRGIPNRYGGFEELAEHLALGLRERGHEVWVYTSSTHPDPSALWQGIHRVVRWDPEPRWGSAGQLVYDALSLLHAERLRPDVLLALGTTSSGFWLNALRSLGFLRKPLVLVHLDGLEWKRGKYGPWVRRFLRWQERWAVEASDTVVADHPALMDYVQKHYPGKARVELAYGAHLPAPCSEEGLQKWNLTAGTYALALSRAVPENHWEMVLQGAAAASIPLVAVADWTTPYGQKLRAQFADIPTIHWLDALFDPIDVETLRQHCRLYYHGHSVGGTNPGLLQAMASGCRIAAHRNPFNHGVLRGDAAYFSSAKEVQSAWEHANAVPADHGVRLADYRWDDVIAGYARAFERLRAR